MYRIIRFGAYARAIAILTAGLSVSAYAIAERWVPGYPVFKIVTLSASISGVILFLFGIPLVSRFLWRVVKRIDKGFFPDLNGTWSGHIELEDGARVEVRAVIRQAMEYTHIDMHGESMKSITLEATPTLEQGQKRLYYVYECRPKKPSFPTYTGSTIFDVRSLSNDGQFFIELTGRYFTDRKTCGRIVLRQKTNDTNIDVSYY